RLGLPYREVLIKNRYIKRTFILNSQKNREEAVDLKLNPVVSEIKGKTVILVDDSIVRGTTSRKIIQLVRRAGAKKVYFVSTCPPIRFPCYYGFDFPEQNELIAAGPNGSRTEEEITKMLDADGVFYQTLDSLGNALSKCSLGLVKNPCTACLTGKYPTDMKGAAELTALRRTDRGKSE
ncbi:MAG TPA: phosphoribosyltransferase family protein, partial [Oligoflexia bacterium]|nr:phosphoribosyltransferase family protein [Oligoflexia bacterium]